jgi:zinc protease
MNRPIARTKEAYTLTATVRDGGLSRGLVALLRETARVVRHGFTETELERQKRIAQRGMERSYLERDKTESNHLVWAYVGHFLRGDASVGIDFGYRFYRDYLPGITLDEVNALSHQWTKGSRVVAVGAPEAHDTPLPGASEIAELIHAAELAEVDAYTDTLPSDCLMVRPPAPGSVVEERNLADVDAVEWTLSNGIRVVLKPTDFKNDEILFSAFSPGGLSLVPDSLIIPALTACNIVSECGVGSFNKTQLDKLLAGSLVRLWPNLSEAFEGFEGSCSPQDLEKALQLVHLYFTEPRADSTAFLAYRARQEEYVTKRGAEPGEVFQDTVTVTINQHHPRSRPWTPELLGELDLETSLNVYRDRFADASDFTFVFVGALDLPMARPLVETYLASLPDRDRTESWRDVGPNRPAGVVAKEVHRGMEPKSRVTLAFPSALAWSTEAVHHVRSMAGVLQIMFRERIREELGGTYGVGIWPGPSRYPREECLSWISFGCDPDRADELVTAVFEEISRLQTDGPDSTDLAKVKEGQRRQFEKNLQENRFWQQALHNSYLHGEPVARILAYPELVDSLTAEDIREAAVTHLDGSRYVKVVLYPEDAEESAAP